MDDSGPLAGFATATRLWFEAAFTAPTTAQTEAWQTIATETNALVVAPTGAGKTLAAFLTAIDRLLTDPPAEPGIKVVYVSPLKALTVDVERNLRRPLAGIRAALADRGEPAPEVTVGVRTGDTTSSARARLVSHPPHILVTTPESLFLMLNSQARRVLSGVETVIVDEIHAVAGSKRGVHLEITLARLSDLVARAGGREPQRIGLSATVNPVELVAGILGGDKPVTVVQPPATKTIELAVELPVPDLTNLTDPQSGKPGSIWPHVEARVLELVLAHRSTIVFVNSRRLAERVTTRVNELYAETSGHIRAEIGAMPAQIMAQSALAAGFDELPSVLARAHHGSLSKARRAEIEHELKSGQLRCVVATSSLELGIDMGEVDLVIQLGAPPSVAGGLQRIGRAGHSVGEISNGVLIPLNRGDVLESLVIAEGIRDRSLERLRQVSGPLDVIAQQLVAMAIEPEVTATSAFDLLRRTSSCRELSRVAFDAVLDMLTGKYPAEQFAELRPRLVWDRDSDVITARPGALRLVSTSGGTIPDRGQYGVFLNPAGQSGDTARRVGELDEEMVHETRVGDVVVLGTSSWLVTDITRDQVLVQPAPAAAGRLPFWKGDAVYRPAELGAAMGRFARRVSEQPPAQVESELAALGADEWSIANLRAYLAEQRAATTRLPTDRTLVLERFRDELGDWRVCLHSALGRQVLVPWALLIEQTAAARGVGVRATATNDGVIMRVPDTSGEPPGADLVAVPAVDVAGTVAELLTASAVFTSRFREAAARALLLPRRDPRARAPLWQQRLRGAQLQEVAIGFPDFPITHEAVRECLQDVFDVPRLSVVLAALQRRELELIEVETRTPSPFAQAMMFGYTDEFLYDDDQPLAERRAAALALDTSLLAAVLGTSLDQILDPGVIADVAAELQRLAPDRLVRSAEALFDLIRVAGPFSRTELDARSAPGVHVGAALTELGNRVLPWREFFVVAADAWVRELSERDPQWNRLLTRWARTHGPFTGDQFAARYGLDPAFTADLVREQVRTGQLMTGRFTAGAPEQVCDREVLAQIKRRSLAALRHEVEPVPPARFAAFLQRWQQIGSLCGVDGTLAAVEALHGCRVPAAIVESGILAARVTDYEPAFLDELLAAGEVSWTGAGKSGDAGWVRLWAGPPVTEPPAAELSERAQALAGRLAGGGSWTVAELAAADDPGGVPATEDALWELVWAGMAGCQSWAPVRGLSGARRRASTRPVSVRRRLSRVGHRPSRRGGSVRWQAVPPAPTAEADADRLAALFDRYGVIHRGSVLAEGDGAFAPVYRALAALEAAGGCLRGYFVAGLGGAQFAVPEAVDALRAPPVQSTEIVQLAACDVANPYGAALDWPVGAAHRPGRKPGAHVLLRSGELLAYLEPGGSTILTFTTDLAAVAASLATGRLTGPITVGTVDGAHVFEHPLGTELGAAGFAMTPQGYRRRATS